MATARTGTAKTSAADTTAEIVFLTRPLKAPTLRDAVGRLAERARAESWSHEQFLMTTSSGAHIRRIKVSSSLRETWANISSGPGGVSSG
ncbi:hypothetical protein SAMN05892883_2767 [Jatrophihabitans sp. GAS493]|nr:hypothetical protein SAMN05892883_2767 [Jatrophihabitans sp. GAS493]